MQSNDPLSQSRQLYSSIINVFSTDEYGLRIFQPQITYKSRPNKAERTQALYPPIPPKHKTKAQQRKGDKLRAKNQAQKLKKLPPATLTPAAWHKAEQKRQSLLKQNRQKVVKEKKEKKQVPVYMNMIDNDTNISHYDDNLNKKPRRSTRNVKPSKRAVESSNYIQNTMIHKPFMNEMFTSDDDHDMYM